MDNRILQAVLADFERRRQQNEAEDARRQAEISEKHPDLYALTQKRHDLIMQSVRKGLNGISQNIEEEMADCSARIAQGLLDRGYPANYLEPVCQCSLCRDTGYVYDRQSLLKPCSCLLAACRTYAAKSEGAEDAQPSFENFDLSRFPADPLPGTDVSQREHMGVVRDKCLEYARGIPEGPVKTLLLHGGSGLGKTYLLRCVEKHAANRGVQSLYVTAYDLLMDLKNAYFSRTGGEAREYFDADLLLIDDLGMEPLMENITVEQIFNLINARLIHGKYTALSTNLSRTELKERYTERLTSRLLDPRSGLVIAFLGRDIRLIRET